MPLKLTIEAQTLTLADETHTYCLRSLDAGAIDELITIAGQYATLASKEENRSGLLELGRRLFVWLDGDDRAMERAINGGQTPLVLEITCLNRSPDLGESAVLDAPWEILADGSGFLAEDKDAVLGFSPVRRLRVKDSAPPPDDHRLGIVFMAASPLGQAVLNYEAEEAAILQAVGEQRIDLVVEESGELKELKHRLGSLKTMTAVHLSCHGNNDPDPVLLLEDPYGNEVETKASELVTAFRGLTPRLLFLSACRSAALPGQAGTGPAQSLAAVMVRSGLPAVLGWNGSVGDAAATVLAREFYAALSDKQSLEDALSIARLSLLKDSSLKRNDWHLARLWLGAQGGGPVVGGTMGRALMPATHGHKEFLGKKQDVPVASHEMFVGRRRELKEGLRVLDGIDAAGLLLWGMGRSGKSSLAARLANRRRDLTLAVVYGEYGAVNVLNALDEALNSCSASKAILARFKGQVADRPEILEQALRALLYDPMDSKRPRKPVLLVIDDLEQILEAPAGDCGPHRVKAAYVSVVQALLRVFDPSQTQSRLLFTSRYRFSLGGLEQKLHPIQLGAFKAPEQAKLLLRQRDAAGALPVTEREARESLVGRAVAVSRGNPGLQDLLVGKLVLNAAVPVARAAQALDEMEAYLSGGDMPKDADARKFLEGLLLKHLLELAGDSGRALLRAATVFELPVPESILDLLAKSVGGGVAHLRGLGLLDPYEDLVAPIQTALAVNALAASRLAPLTEEESVAIVEPQLLDALFAAWGGEEPRGKPIATTIELFRLALGAGNAHIVATCGGYAVGGLVTRVGNLSAARMGQAALALCEAQHVMPSVIFMRVTSQACLAAGEPEDANAILTKIAARFEQASANGNTIDAGEQAGFHFDYGQLLQGQGKPDEAESQYKRMSDVTRAANMEREYVIAQGKIADIRFRRGQLDEAMRIRQEQELPVYEKLGDVREMAVCQGQIADILRARGQLDEAMRIRQEQELPVYEKLGDVRSVAVTQGKIADILFRRGQLDKAMRIRQEQELPVYEKLGDVRSVAVTQGFIADILMARGQLDEAMRIRQEQELPVYEKLGDVRSVAVTQGQIADILMARGQLDEAMRIRQELQLPVYEKLGDVRSVAVCQGKIADILRARGQLDEAMRIRQEQELPVYEKLGDVRSVAVTQGQIADILRARGQLDEAMRIRQEQELPVYEKLGDVREMAVCQGKIADILMARGQLDEAMRIRQEQELPVYEKLGDKDGIASSLWGIAQIEMAQKNLTAAAPKIAEAYNLFSEMGLLEGIAFIGQIFGQLLIGAGHPEDGLTVLQRSIDGFRQLGREDDARETEAILAQVREYLAGLPKNAEEESN